MPHRPPNSLQPAATLGHPHGAQANRSFDVLSVRCPYCGAAEGQRCVAKHLHIIHARRLRAYQRAVEKRRQQVTP